jgi:hypothetical protein
LSWREKNATPPKSRVVGKSKNDVQMHALRTNCMPFARPELCPLQVPVRWWKKESMRLRLLRRLWDAQNSRRYSAAGSHVFRDEMQSLLQAKKMGQTEALERFTLRLARKVPSAEIRA